MEKEKITFRIITPIYGFTCWTSIENGGFRRGGAFAHSGTFKTAKYSIRIYEASGSSKNFQEMTAGLGDQKIIYELMFPHFGGEFEDYYLVIDTIHERTEELETSSNTRELCYIHHAMVKALRLHTMGGFNSSRNYTYRIPAARYSSGVGISSRLGGGEINPFIVGQSTLSNETHGDIIKTFKILLVPPWSGTQFERVLDIAMDSIQLYLHAGNIKHAFLLLMVACEALFKKNGEESVSQYSSRLAKFISISSTEKKSIGKKFTIRPGGLGDKRNRVAHGDPDFSDADIKAGVPVLLDILQRSIVKMIRMHATAPSTENNYYEWLDEQINKNSLKDKRGQEPLF